MLQTISLIVFSLMVSGFLYWLLSIFSPLIPMIILKCKHWDEVYFDFRPILGFFKDFRRSRVQHGDSLLLTKNLLRNHPNVKILVSNLLSRPYLLVVDPELQKVMYQDHHLYERLQQQVGKEKVFDLSIGFLSGEKWKNLRNLMSGSFTYDQLKGRIPMFKEVVQRHFNDEFPIREKLTLMTGEMVIRSFFGEEHKDVQCDGEPAPLYFTRFLHELMSFMLENKYCSFKYSLLGPKLANRLFLSKGEIKLNHKIHMTREFARSIAEARLQKYREKPSEDIQQDLLGQQIVSKLRSGRLDDNDMEEIIQNFLFMFLAGTDTSSITSLAALYYLGEQQDAQEEIYQEITKFEEINETNIGQLVKLAAFINETLRLKNPVYFPRTRNVKENHYLGNYYLKKGWKITPAFSLALTREEFFLNGDHFDYRRWLKDDSVKINNQFLYAPFAAGPRSCIGQHMAMFEMKIILSAFLKKYRIHIKNDAKAKWVVKLIYIMDNPEIIQFTLRQ